MNLNAYTLPSGVTKFFYAAALLAFGIQHFVFGFFIAGRPMPWPERLPGEIIVACISGALLIAAALAVIINKKAVELLVAVAILILVWAGLRNVIHVVTELDTGGSMTNMGKALTLGFGALLVAHYVKPESKNRVRNIAIVCQYATGLFLLLSGIQHFLYADFVMFLVPAWIPGALFWTYFSGIALAAAGLGLITGTNSRLAAILAGWMIFIWLIILHLPRAIENNNQNEWTAVFEALAISGILFLMADTILKKTK